VSSKAFGKKKPVPSVEPTFSFGGIAKIASGTFLSLALLGGSIATGLAVGLAVSFRNLPSVQGLSDYVPTETSYIYDIKGKLLDSLHGEAHRKVIKLDRISPHLKRAVMAIEDSHFYTHKGVNPYSTGRALLVNIKSQSVVEGSSTLTMQLVKNLFLTPERSLNRKIAEAVLAVRVEQVFTKDKILDMYLNNIYWGHNNYGAETAAESYFNKSAADLDLSEATLMAGLIQAPESYSPFINLKEAKRRQALVLQRMADLGWITTAEKNAALKKTLKLGKPTAWQQSKLPYITEVTIEELKKRFGEEAVTKGGLRIQTTVDYEMQKMAEATVKERYKILRGAGVRADQIVLVAVDPRTHYVKALVGGVNFEKSQFNRAVQSRRQPGSAFKPFVYYAAFASGKYTPESSIADSFVRYREGSGYYIPKNYGGGYSGNVSIRHSLAQSLNVPAVKLGKEVGLSKVIEICKLLGIESPLEPVISLPLGAVGVTPLEMAGAYATFANNGWSSPTTTIALVTDSQGGIIVDNTPKPKLILDRWATASLTNTLQSVINGGTGKNAAIGRPAAGKTGTTSSERDVWFVGYVPQLSVAVWVGNDNYGSLGKGITGGTFAAPIWRSFMTKALKNEPVIQFPAASKFPKPKAPPKNNKSE
jgi:penicillin-binding protein 1A